MRITKRNTKDRLVNWMSNRLPRSLVLKILPQGYGFVACVYIRGHEPGMFSLGTGDPVAKVGENLIELFHPQYQSDFEDLLRAYDAESGTDTELQVWNGGA